MIVRISGLGQYRVDDSGLPKLNELDNAAVAAVEAGDEDGFRTLLNQMHDLVRAEGAPLSDDELVESQVIVPPADTSLAEAQADFSGEGLIPD